MVRPSVVFELGIHHVSRTLYSLPDAASTVHVPRPTLVVNVPPDVAFVHHYRDCTNDYEYDLSCNTAKFVADSRLADAGYIPTLRQRVRTRLGM